MSKIDGLIKQHCPDGVAFRELGELIDYEQPGKYIVDSTNYSNKHSTPVLTAGQSFILGYTNEEHGVCRASLEKPVIVFDDFTTSFHWVDFNFKVKSSAMKILRPKTGAPIDFRFVYFAMRCIDYSPTDHTRHWISQYSKFTIPVPPLEVQRAIVELLDKFTSLEVELEAGLEAELEARKKQYEFYRNQLLSFDESGGARWTTLGEVGMLIRGNGLQKKDFTDEGVGAVHYGQIYTYYGTFADKTKSFVSPELAKKLKKAEKGDVLIAGVSENIEDVLKPLGWLGGEICISGDMFAFRHNQNPKYITYLLQTADFQRYKERNSQGTKVVRVRADKILQYKIPLPPLEEQNRVASMLDKFEGLVNNITESLPAEINARRKQYEYYRNKLLTFQELPA